jgi:hypothetical protein
MSYENINVRFDANLQIRVLDKLSVKQNNDLTGCKHTSIIVDVNQ